MNDEKKSQELEKVMGTPWIFIVQLLMLMAKHQETCIILPLDINEFTTKIQYKQFSSFCLTWNSTFNKLEPPYGMETKKYVQTVRKCTEEHKQFTVIPLTMEKMSKDMNKREGGHQVFLIYDKLSNSLERYEPNGMESPHGYQVEDMDKKIKILFSYIFNTDLTYYKPDSFCPKQGPQYIEFLSRKELPYAFTKGTCSLWSAVYVDTRLSNPTLTRMQIHDKIINNIKKNDRNMYNYIVDYLKNIYGIAKLLRQSTSSDEITDILIKNLH